MQGPVLTHASVEAQEQAFSASDDAQGLELCRLAQSTAIHHRSLGLTSSSHVSSLLHGPAAADYQPAMPSCKHPLARKSTTPVTLLELYCIIWCSCWYSLWCWGICRLACFQDRTYGMFCSLLMVRCIIRGIAQSQQVRTSACV